MNVQLGNFRDIDPNYFLNLSSFEQDIVLAGMSDYEKGALAIRVERQEINRRTMRELELSKVLFQRMKERFKDDNYDN